MHKFWGNTDMGVGGKGGVGMGGGKSYRKVAEQCEFKILEWL